jgi:hypothetical protein
MKEQHKAILKELIAGKYPVDGEEAEKKEEMVSSEQLGISMAEPEMGKSKDKTLDDILLDYIMQREKEK